jgi:hypothetical protein
MVKAASRSECCLPSGLEHGGEEKYQTLFVWCP